MTIQQIYGTVESYQNYMTFLTIVNNNYSDAEKTYLIGMANWMDENPDN